MIERKLNNKIKINKVKKVNNKVINKMSIQKIKVIIIYGYKFLMHKRKKLSENK